MSAKRKTTRREFLVGRSAAEELLDLTNGVGPAAATLPSPAGQEQAGYLHHFSRPAMACDFEVFLNMSEDSHAPDAALAALDLVDALEDQLSVFREQSEVSRLNRRAAAEAVVVEAQLFGLLEAAVAIHRQTSGAFDITSGPLTKVWGFYRRAGRVPTDDELAEAKERVGSRWLKLDPAASTVRFLQPGVEINLGAIGKGYTLDRCAASFEAAGTANFILHGGMSSVLARGSRTGQSRAAGGWTVGVVHPLRPQQRLTEIYLRDRALGTSGAGAQFFHYQGKKYGHILDPRTGHPAEGVLSATVMAPTAAWADALATAFYVLGVEQSLEFCRSRPELAALLVVPAARSGGVEIHTAGLGEDEWRLF